jgi:hypothetical protein
MIANTVRKLPFSFQYRLTCLPERRIAARHLLNVPIVLACLLSSV